MAKSIPTLGTTGWTSDLAKSADYILACYITTLTADSVLHREQNTSMQYTLKVRSGDMIGIEEDMATDLRIKFQSIFGASAETTVSIDLADENVPDQYSISYTGVVYDDTGKSYTVGRLVYFDNGAVVKIANINNG